MAPITISTETIARIAEEIAEDIDENLHKELNNAKMKHLTDPSFKREVEARIDYHIKGLENIFHGDFKKMGKVAKDELPNYMDIAKEDRRFPLSYSLVAGASLLGVGYMVLESIYDWLRGQPFSRFASGIGAVGCTTFSVSTILYAVLRNEPTCKKMDNYRDNLINKMISAATE